MRSTPAGEHAEGVTRYGAGRPPAGDAERPGPAAVDARGPSARPPDPAAAGGGPAAPDELAMVLAQAEAAAIEAVGGFAGGLYMRTTSPELLLLAVIAGLPSDLFRHWWRMHVNRPFPHSEAYRSGRPVYLGDAEEAMRRYPQLMAGLPFPFGSLYVPIVHRRDTYGIIAVLRPGTPGRGVEEADRRRITGIAARLGETLAAMPVDGRIQWEGDPLAVTLPSVSSPPVRFGTFDWDLDAGTVTGDEGWCSIMGAQPAGLPLTVDEVAARVEPADAYGLWAVARHASESDRPVTRRIRLQGADGRPHLVEMSGRRGRRRGGSGGTRLTGFLVDLGAGPVVAESADRLPQGVCSVDRLGRVTYLNRHAETMVGLPRSSLLGTVLWESVPWLGQPAYEDYYRSALLSGDPAHFLVQRDQGWLSVSVFAGHDGLTVTMGPADQPAYTPGSVVAPGTGMGSPADRAVALYRPVALAIALTEAVTARQVSAVVTEELLPAFGGRQLAIYLLNDRHLYLSWETGFPRGFLDRFDGVGLDSKIPGVDTLTTGRPLFFESMHHLAEAYPGIPLDAHVGARAFLPLIASGRPVGSCILGFDQPRGFSPEERTVLTALAGLIAQALQRAQRYDSEAALARGLQDGLLPRRLPIVDQLDTVACHLPGTQGMDVGGDWYDVVETARGVAIVIGDVQGHGVSAAATMGQLRSAVRALAVSGHGPAEVMGGTNRLLIDLDPGQFASCCYILLDPAGGRAEAVRAGHLQPLLRRPDGRTEVLDLPGGVVLGVDADAEYPVTDFHLERGAVLAMFTDGLVETPGIDIDIGIERLRLTLSDVGASPLGDTADRLINEARQTPDRPDDIALLLAARWIEAPDRPPARGADHAPAAHGDGHAPGARHSDEVRDADGDGG
ncbi:SpoIIE family protein phosphatase [Streptomyces sp. t39]|uniref:SpoIIE family protein phosphatase n=1 Tax=Streptomyces sp. t39 TaxID=1828156 RepID=UPI0011CDBB5C|nr:SpoIIE family protein phosphatase [Streptomyces sp. t39]TXS44876.1 GAF domain-containing protein [Streptomyces sp. t39]